MIIFEQIIFLDTDSPERDRAFEYIDDGDYEGAINYLKEWWWPGEHETSDEPGHGHDDETYDGKAGENDGFLLSWNSGLEYVSLEYEDEE